MDYPPRRTLEPMSVRRAAAISILVTGLLFLAYSLFSFLSFEEPQVSYSCSPEQPHLSVKECVR